MSSFLLALRWSVRRFWRRLRSRHWRREQWQRLCCRLGLSPAVYLQIDTRGQAFLIIDGIDPTKSLWRETLLRDPCVYCGAPSMTLDHIRPRSNGGLTENPQWRNLAPACKLCNHAKGADGLLLFLVRRPLCVNRAALDIQAAIRARRIEKVRAHAASRIGSRRRPSKAELRLARRLREIELLPKRRHPYRPLMHSLAEKMTAAMETRAE